eukprot:9024266-Karenia_brevis.AAC.1
MDQSLLHRVPEEGISKEPLEHVLMCCPRCQEPLCNDMPTAGSRLPNCSACGLQHPPVPHPLP